MLVLTFQWNALRVGDHVLVHDDLDPGFVMHEATVKLVQTLGHAANEIALRLDDRPTEIVYPRRQAVHLTPITRRSECWRCGASSERVAATRRAST